MHQVADDIDAASAESARAIVEAAAALRPAIRDCQEVIERERRIPPSLVEQLRGAGLYRMVIPRQLGGAQVDQLTFMRAVELVSEGDGSVGWNLATSTAGALTALSFPYEGLEEVFERGPDVAFAGSIGPGTARGMSVDGGYMVTGRWPFGSGCQAADWMQGTFVVLDGEEPRLDPGATPLLMRALFRASECTVIDTWDVAGLRGTGSHDWSVTSVFVPERRTVRYPGQPIMNRWSRWPGTLYQLPGSAVLGGSHFSPVATGIARAGIDALADLAGSKIPRTQTGLLREQSQVQEWVGRAEALLGSAQAYRAAVATDVWRAAAAGVSVTLDQLARCRLAAVNAADAAMQATDLMYRAGGTTSIQQAHAIARCWRDVHVVGQNAALLPDAYLQSGRVFLGLDPDPRRFS